LTRRNADLGADFVRRHPARGNVPGGLIAPRRPLPNAAICGNGVIGDRGNHCRYSIGA